jgi:hypothetical protein
LFLLHPFFFYLCSFLFSVDFRDENLSDFYWQFSSISVFISVVTLTISSLSKNTSRKVKWGMILLSPIFGITAFVGILIYYLTLFGLGKWTDITMLGRSKNKGQKVIIEQFYDGGALGWNGKRIVEQTDFWWWQKNNEIDTTKINWSSYYQENREIGPYKFP